MGLSPQAVRAMTYPEFFAAQAAFRAFHSGEEKVDHPTADEWFELEHGASPTLQ